MGKNTYQDDNKKGWEEHFSTVNLDYPNEAVVRFMAKCKKIFPGGNVLDWGCGTGRHTILACSFGFNVYAADYVQVCIEKTQKKYAEKKNELAGRIEQYILNGDINIEQIENDTMDIIICLGVAFLNTPENEELLLKNEYRMLKKGGMIFVDFRSEYDSIYIDRSIGEVIGDNIFRISDNSTSLPGQLECILQKKDLINMIEKVGFNIESMERYEFTQNNEAITNSWWHCTLIK